MTLACGCDWEPEPGQLCSYPADDFEPLATIRGRRCRSCGVLIKVGALSLKFVVSKAPENEVEINIYGEDGEIPMANRYLCEKCGEIYFNLRSVGFSCIWVGDDMRELLREYQETYVPQKKIKV